MKKKHRKLLSLTLAIAAVALLCTGLILTIAADSEVSVQNGTGTSTAIRASEHLAYRAKVNGEFTGFAYFMPTWATSDSDCTLALYKWDGSLTTSLAAEPIASRRFENLVDNATASTNTVVRVVDVDAASKPLAYGDAIVNKG